MGRIISFIDIRKGFDGTYLQSEIQESIALRGVNTWLLMCSALLASIGLNTNSTAVIIGAMLVSPLMSPILGIGLGVGTLNRELIRASLISLGLKVITAYAAASLYFYFSPFQYVTSEMEARTAPTLLDVLIAFFGGLAGIVSMSQKKVSNAIPGVAIATALMPPLCTSAYGWVHQDYRIMGGAFYLFFINTVFISLATLLMIRYFNMPLKTHISPSARNKTLLMAAIFLVITVLPGTYFLFQTLYEQKNEKRISTFVKSRIERSGIEIINTKMVNRGTTKTIKVYIFSNLNLQDSIETWNREFSRLGLSGYQMEVIKTNLSKKDIENINLKSSDPASEGYFAAGSLFGILSQTEGEQLTSELKVLFPDYQGWKFGYLTGIRSDSIAVNDTIPVCYVKMKPAGPTPTDQKKIASFLKTRLKTDSVAVWIDGEK